MVCGASPEPAFEPALAPTVDACLVSLLLVEVEDGGQHLHDFRFLAAVGHGVAHHQVLDEVAVHFGLAKAFGGLEVAVSLGQQVVSDGQVLLEAGDLAGLGVQLVPQAVGRPQPLVGLLKLVAKAAKVGLQTRLLFDFKGQPRRKEKYYIYYSLIYLNSRLTKEAIAPSLWNKILNFIC